MKLTWLGHSSVLVDSGGILVLADPLLRGRIGMLRRAAPLPVAAEGLGRTAVLDAVLVSHLHHDHCDLPTLRRIRTRLLVVPPGSARWLARHGVPGAVELAPGESLSLGGGVRVVATPAEHLGRRHPWGPTAMCVGHLVDTPSGSAWLAGDTGLFDGMTALPDLAQRGTVDVAAIPVWGWGPTVGPGHLDPVRAAQAAIRSGARNAVPVHWGTLHPAFLRRTMHPQLTTPGDRFAQALTATGSGVARVLPVGGSWVLPER